MDTEDRKRLEEIENSIEKLYDEQSRKLFDYIVQMGEEALWKANLYTSLETQIFLINL